MLFVVHVQTSVPKIGMPMSQTACINPLHVFSAGFCIFQRVTIRDYFHIFKLKK